jgi:hypothetical protein
MTDRELLELAAKAAYGDFEYEDTGILWISDNGRPRTFDPLKNDGDALRLAVKCGFEITQMEGGGCDVTLYRQGCAPHVIAEIGMDANAATRRAIVRAAAEIGKSIQTEEEKPQ